MAAPRHSVAGTDKNVPDVEGGTGEGEQRRADQPLRSVADEAFLDRSPAWLRRRVSGSYGLGDTPGYFGPLRDGPRADLRWQVNDFIGSGQGRASS